MEALKDHGQSTLVRSKMFWNSTRRSSLLYLLLFAIVFIGFCFQPFNASPSAQSGAHFEDSPRSQEAHALQTEMKSPIVIGKVTMCYGKMAESEVFQRVLQGHRDHADMHNYAFHVLERPTMPEMYSKMAHILQIVLAELAKPEQERVQWIFWYDLDIVVMNKQIPLEVYLPPKDEFKHIHLLVCNDANGMNSGAFFLRVNTWAAEMLMEALTFHVYKPAVKLRWGDQSAMENVVKDPKRLSNVVFIPQRWVNAYMGPRNGTSDGSIAAGEAATDNTIMQGDLQVHFAGRYKQFIPQWLDFGANDHAGWNVALSATDLVNETTTFWVQEKARQLVAWEAEKSRREKAIKEYAAMRKSEEVVKAKLEKEKGIQPSKRQMGERQMAKP